MSSITNLSFLLVGMRALVTATLGHMNRVTLYMAGKKAENRWDLDPKP